MSSSIRVSAPFKKVTAIDNVALPAVSMTDSVPAPVGGLNARDSLAAMPEADAVIMENFFPQPTYVSLRSGSSNYATGLPSWVETLMTYGSASGRKLFAISSGGIYDVTSGGVAGAAAVSGLTNSTFEYANHGTPGGQFLYACNATDAPRLFDGTTWYAITGVSAPYAITGVTTTKLRNPVSWKNRLWFVEDGSMNAWYLPTQAIAGAAQSIPLGSVCKLGGYLMSIITCTIDSASNIDDYIGFLTSEGELVLYRGSDPAVAGTFSLVGLFRIGRPVGRRCWTKYGADTIFVTQDGYMTLSSLIQKGEDDLSSALSNKIVNLVNQDFQNYNANPGWQPILFPLGNKLIINVPETTTYVTSHQWVMNTITRSWAKFTGWNAACFEVVADRLYYGGNGVVVRADTGTSDNGSLIYGYLKPAFSYFDTKRQKQFKMVRPLLQVNGQISVGLNLNTDFQDNQTTPPTFSVGGNAGGTWDVSPWDTTAWGDALTIQSQWQSAPGIGFAATVYMAIASSTVTVNVMAFDYTFEVGGVL